MAASSTANTLPSVIPTVNVTILSVKTGFIGRVAATNHKAIFIKELTMPRTFTVSGYKVNWYIQRISVYINV